MKLFLTSLLLIGCKFNQNNKSENDYYLKTKSSFQNSLISHFPNSLTTSARVIIDLKNIDKNDVGLILVENENSKKTIDSLELVLSELALKRYNSNDTCLFLINNFETYKSYEQRTEVQILDSFAIKKKCNDSLLPIPNFIEYSINFIAFDKTKIFLKNFDIYVIEAKSGYSFSDYKLKPNYQMPTGWENGFTRGIAINKDERIVIYYGKIW